MVCPNCAEEVFEGAVFCETCGIKISSGIREVVKREPQIRDHIEIELAPHFAGVTDRGRKHSRNEDALALAFSNENGVDAALLVVCDGVSTSQEPDKASEAAAQTALKVLGNALIDSGMTAADAMLKAVAAAHKAVSAVPHTKSETKDPPLTTIVAAMVQGSSVTVGWVGDSRAYLLTANDTRQLTHDHSYINQVVDAGIMTPEEAEKSPQAHAITLCLGLYEDGSEEETPQAGVLTQTVSAGNRLLLCTDGLWNYAPTAEKIAALAADSETPETSLALCRRLTGFANLQGGHDNITVAVLTI